MRVKREASPSLRDQFIALMWDLSRCWPGTPVSAGTDLSECQANSSPSKWTAHLQELDAVPGAALQQRLAGWSCTGCRQDRGGQWCGILAG